MRWASRAHWRTSWSAVASCRPCASADASSSPSVRSRTWSSTPVPQRCDLGTATSARYQHPVAQPHVDANRLPAGLRDVVDNAIARPSWRAPSFRRPSAARGGVLAGEIGEAEDEAEVMPLALLRNSNPAPDCCPTHTSTPSTGVLRNRLVVSDAGRQPPWCMSTTSQRPVTCPPGAPRLPLRRTTRHSPCAAGPGGQRESRLPVSPTSCLHAIGATRRIRSSSRV
jgi:hypothetical protein